MKDTNTETPDRDNTNNITDRDSSDHFTLNTTVGEVLSDPAFGDFGRLLFPVDRAISTDMTLAQLSTSNVYV